MRLDDLDAAILRTLLREGRSSFREVAARVGSTPTTVGARIERLEEMGLLGGATLRLDAAQAPGHVRLVEGQVAAGEGEPVLAAARSLPGVVEAVVTSEGRLVVVAHVADLEGEEALTASLRSAGATAIVTIGARRVSGPPATHLFEGPVVVAETCAVCGRASTEPLVGRFDGRRVPFCCPSCRDVYAERYERHKAASGV